MSRIFSLRIRMMILFCAVVGMFLAGTLFALYGLFAREVVSQLDCRLLRVGNTIIADLKSGAANWRIEDLDIPDEYFEVLDDSGNVLQRSKSIEGRAVELSGGEDFSKPAYRNITDGARGPLRVALIPFTQQSESRMLAVAMPTSHNDLVLRTVRRSILTLLPLSLLITAGISVWYVGRSLRPVGELRSHAWRIMEAITRAPNDIAELEQSLEIPVPASSRNDELGQLASTYNMLFTRLNAVSRQQRKFITDASHELRTPLHVLCGEAQLLLSQPRAVEDYAQSLHVMDEELRKLSRILEALFTLSMADSGELRLNSEPLYLNDMIEQAANRIRPLAREKNISIQCSWNHDVQYKGDEALLQELCFIFLDNAIKYSAPGTRVTVTLETVANQVRIKFQDQGYGISAQDLPHIFERFYRGTTHGNGETRSGGLGLAIAQAVAHAQGGKIECESTLGGNTTFTVTLPGVDRVAVEGHANQSRAEGFWVAEAQGSSVSDFTGAGVTE